MEIIMLIALVSFFGVCVYYSDKKWVDYCNARAERVEEEERYKDNI